MYKDITLELIVGFLALLITLKLLGKIQFSQITPFDFITGLVLGNLVSEGILDNTIGLKKILFCIIIWGLLIYCVELLTQKSRLLRSIFEGTPAILVHKGEILYQHLKKNHIDINQLQQMLRKQGYFSVFEAEYVILERDGQVSVAPKHNFGAPTKQDLKIPEQQVNLPFTLIMDGELNADTLRESGYDEEWLQNQLTKQNIKGYKEVFYAEWQEYRGLKIAKYN